MECFQSFIVNAKHLKIDLENHECANYGFKIKLVQNFMREDTFEANYEMNVRASTAPNSITREIYFIFDLV